MHVTAHCFLKKAKIDKLPIRFNFRDMEVKIDKSSIPEDDGLILETKQKVDVKELMIDPSEKDEKGEFIGKRLKKYKAELHELATLIEGIFSVNYMVSSMPRFETHRVTVNVFPENEEERKMIGEGKVTGGFGDITTPEKHPEFSWKDNLFGNIEKIAQHLPALSFITQAIRSQYRKDEEIAFFLYFRIIEGYFGDGTPQIEKALLQNKEELKKYLPPKEDFKNALQNILKILNLPSRAETNYEGIISDLVLLRHKLVHFDEANAERYFSPKLKFELSSINKHLRLATTLIIRDKIG